MYESDRIVRAREIRDQCEALLIAVKRLWGEPGEAEELEWNRFLRDHPELAEVDDA